MGTKKLTIAEELHLFGESYLGKYVRVAYDSTSVYYIFSDSSYIAVSSNGFKSTGLIIK